MTVSGTLDTAKYKDIKITSNVAYWEAVQIDKDGKEIAATKHKFKLDLYKNRNPQAWDGGSTKEIVNGQEVNFAGFLPGTYKVTVEMNVKETPTSEERAAKITVPVIIPDPVPESLPPGEVTQAARDIANRSLSQTTERGRKCFGTIHASGG